MLGKKVGEKSGSGSSDVEIASWRRRVPSSDLFHRFILAFIKAQLLAAMTSSLHYNVSTHAWQSSLWFLS